MSVSGWHLKGSWQPWRGGLCHFVLALSFSPRARMKSAHISYLFIYCSWQFFLCEAFLACLSAWLVSRLDLGWQIWCQASKCIAGISVLLALSPLGCSQLSQTPFMWFHIYFMTLMRSTFLFHRSHNSRSFPLVPCTPHTHSLSRRLDFFLSADLDSVRTTFQGMLHNTLLPASILHQFYNRALLLQVALTHPKSKRIYWFMIPRNPQVNLDLCAVWFWAQMISGGSPGLSIFPCWLSTWTQRIEQLQDSELQPESSQTRVSLFLKQTSQGLLSWMRCSIFVNITQVVCGNCMRVSVCVCQYVCGKCVNVSVWVIHHHFYQWTLASCQFVCQALWSRRQNIQTISESSF